MEKITFYLMNKKGLQVLKSLISNNMVNIIDCVVGSEDKNIKNDYFNEIKDLCRQVKIIFFNRIEYKGSGNFFKIAVGWRWMIKDSSNLIVFHDSLLPKYRGFSPLVNALINGDRKVGVSSLFASKEYDKGNIISQRELGVTYPKKISDAIDEISVLYQEMVVEIVNKIRNNISIESCKQKEENATYSIWRDEEDYFINWNWPSEKISRLIDATCYPYNGARCLLDNEILKINESEIINDVEIENRDVGKVIRFKDNCPVVICGKGLLKLSDIESLTGKKIKINKFRSRFK